MEESTEAAVKPTTDIVTPAGEHPSHKREQWGSRVAFVFAAVGSAVGFGNVWRFPSLCQEYGGGAFLVPYILALFVIGIPVIFLEISLGQFWQTGDVGVFASFHRRMIGTGVASVACGFMLVTFYSMLIAWVVHAFFDSWSDDAPWTQPGVNGTVARDYFYNEIVGMSTLGEDGTATRLVGANVGYSALVWFIIWGCVAFGLKWTGRITYFTMGLPIILMFVFLGRGVSLEGSEDGIEQYIGIWDMSVLTERGDVWSTAVSQIFFSLSVTFGIMTAYGSHLPRNEPAFFNSCTVAICNCLFSFISGFAVFAAQCMLFVPKFHNQISTDLEGVEVTQLEIKGFSLVFGTWPVVLGTLPGGIHWIRLLFFDLFLLGIDSAFSFLEGFLTVARDTVYFQGTPKWKMTAGLCVAAFLFNLMYATDAGLNWLDVVDFYINFVMLLVGFFETFALGWVYGIEQQVEKFGGKVVCIYALANFGAVLLASILWFTLNNHALWAGFVGLVGWYLIGLGMTLKLLEFDMAKFWDLAFGNVLDFRERVSPVVGRVPKLFCYMVKQLIPHLLLLLFINLAQAKNEDGTAVVGNYGGYVKVPFQVMGILIVVFALVLFSAGVLAPSVYSFLALPDDFIQPADVMSSEFKKPVAENVDAEQPAKDLEQDESPVKDVEDAGHDSEEVASEEGVA